MNNSNHALLSRFSYLLFSNFIKLLSSLLIGFVVPSILGVEDYGYYKIYALYLSYVGLFHFGFIDGIYLIYSGSKYSEINRKLFRMFSRHLLILETIITVVFLFLSIVIFDGIKQQIFVLLSLNLLSINFNSYFQFISQATNRFKEYSSRMLIQSLTNLIIVGIMFTFRYSDYYMYIILLTVSNYLLTFWYLFTYREITFGISDEFDSTTLMSVYKEGIPLLIANLVSVLIMTVDRQFVEIFFDIRIFALYSFAYSLLSLVSIFVNSLKVFLYPTLKLFKQEDVLKFYSSSLHKLSYILIVSFLVYYPFSLIVEHYLYDYFGSIDIFQFYLPAFMFSSIILILVQNYYKYLNINGTYLIIGLFVIIFKILLNYIGLKTFNDIKAVSIFNSIGNMLWFIILSYVLSRRIKHDWQFITISFIISIVVFYVTNVYLNPIHAFVSYILYLSIISITIYRKTVLEIWNLLKKSIVRRI